MRDLRSIFNNLRLRLFLISGVLLGILILAIGIGVLYFIYQTEQTAWQERQAEAATSAAERVAAFMTRARDNLQFVANLNPDQLARDQEFLPQLWVQNPALLEVVRLNKQAEVIADEAQGTAVLSHLFTTSQSNWFRAAQGGKNYLGEMQVAADQEPYLIIALPVTQQGKEQQGVVAARLRMNLLWEVVRQTHFGESGIAYVINRRGQIVAHPDTKIVLAQTRLSADSLLMNALTNDTKTWQGRYPNLQGNEVLGVVAQIADTDWLIVTELPISEAFSTLRLAAILFIVGAILTEALALAASMYLLDKAVIRPLRTLRRGAVRVGQGDLSRKLPVRRSDEIGYVTQAFNDMVRQLKTREIELAAQAQVLATEVDEHRETENALRNSEQVNRAILDALPDALFRVNGEGVFLSYKASKEVQIFRNPGELQGASLHSILPADLVGPALAMLTQTLRTGETQTLEYEFSVSKEQLEAAQLLDRQLPYEHFHYEIRFVITGENEVLAIVRNATERIQREELLQVALQHEKELGELKSRFMTLMSHEFRTPLAIILASRDLLERFSSNMAEAKRAQHLAAIATQVHHLTHILDDIIIISRAETIGIKTQFRSIQLEQLCQSVLFDSESLFIDHPLNFSSKGENISANVDEKLMRQALTNLLSNATKYSSAGSAIDFHLFRQGENAVIQVRDYGIGIPEEDLKRVFDIFHRAQNTDHLPGIGLGLAIVRQAAQLHGGDIEVESKLNEGTTFRMRLPLITGEPKTLVATPQRTKADE